MSDLLTNTRSLTTAIKDDTSSIRRNVKETAFGLDQIVQVLAVLPERVAAQLQVGALNEATIVDNIRPALQLPAPEPPVTNSARKLESLFPPMNSKDQTPSNLYATAVQSSRELAVVAAESTPSQPINTTQDQASQSRKWWNPQSKLQQPQITKVIQQEQDRAAAKARQTRGLEWQRARQLEEAEHDRRQINEEQLRLEEEKLIEIEGESCAM